MWEYHVLVDGSQEPVDYITVIFPLPQMIGGEATTRAADTTAGDWTEEPWYRARHQTFNAWSYDPRGEPAFPDYDPDQLILAPYDQGGDVDYAFSEGATMLLYTFKTKPPY